MVASVSAASGTSTCRRRSAAGSQARKALDEAPAWSGNDEPISTVILTSRLGVT